MTLVTQQDVKMRAIAYVAAWCSHVPEDVASFFALNGRITINDGDPSIGQAGITEMAIGFIGTFPDIIVHMDDFRSSGTHAVLSWTLEGHNTGPAGTGNYVKVSGWEYWRYDSEGLIAESFGHFDHEDYEQQINGVK
jgi:hypothetical protein